MSALVALAARSRRITLLLGILALALLAAAAGGVGTTPVGAEHAASAMAGVQPSAGTAGASSGSVFGTWRTGTAMPTARSEVTSALLDGNIYVIGGFNGPLRNSDVVEAYDTAADSWSVKAPLPQPLNHAGAAAVGDKLYVVGGYIRFFDQIISSATYEYDPATDQWTAREPMPLARGAAATVAVDDMIYVLGGVGPQATVPLAYDPTSDAWTQLAPMNPQPSHHHVTASVVDGKIYVFGGRIGGAPIDQNPQQQDTVQVYDPATDTWQTLTSMPTARSGLASAALAGRVHVVGGEDAPAGVTFSEHEVYDPASDSWLQAPSLPTPRHGLAAEVVDDTLYFIGGGPVGDAVEIFQLSLLETPVNFIRGTVSGSGFTTIRPTAIAYGPDDRLYVADWEGRVQALTLDPVSKKVIAVEQVASNDDLQEVYGIAFDPTDAASPPPVYVTNTLSGVGSAGPPPPGIHAGKITKIDGAGYVNKTDVITGLPNGLHFSNGLAFADDGTLYIAQGSLTNAGLPGETFPKPEVPLSAALLVASPSAPGFDGNITYDPPNTYDTTVDQISGDVSVYAAGLRNSYDFIIHSNGRIYATDNGPNAGEGPASTGCDSQVDDPWAPLLRGPDELNLIEEGNYYGHPNRNRGRFDPRQCAYHSGTEGDGADWTGPIGTLPTSSDGIVEYTAGAFASQLLGNLFYVSFVHDVLGRIVLSPDGTFVVGHTEFASGFSKPLDLTIGPDGTLYIAEFVAGQITYLQPDSDEDTIPDSTDPDIDGDGCTNQQELGPDERFGGRRNPVNPWDFYDVNSDKVVNLFDDIILVASAFGPSADPSLDRSPPPLGADTWDMGPPDGTINIFDDIFGVANQFGHDCMAPP